MNYFSITAFPPKLTIVEFANKMLVSGLSGTSVFSNFVKRTQTRVKGSITGLT